MFLLFTEIQINSNLKIKPYFASILKQNTQNIVFNQTIALIKQLNQLDVNT